VTVEDAVVTNVGVLLVAVRDGGAVVGDTAVVLGVVVTAVVTAVVTGRVAVVVTLTAVSVAVSGGVSVSVPTSVVPGSASVSVGSGA